RELLSQPPDEGELEQWSSWVELAVTAERKGQPVPEFAELRLPLPPSLLPPAPEGPRVGVPLRPPEPGRFAALGGPRREAPAAFGETAAPRGPIVTRDRYETSYHAPWRAAPGPPPPPGAAHGYARLPNSSSAWLDRFARGLGPTRVWVPIAVLFGLLATSP